MVWLNGHCARGHTAGPAQATHSTACMWPRHPCWGKRVVLPGPAHAVLCTLWSHAMHAVVSPQHDALAGGQAVVVLAVRLPEVRLLQEANEKQGLRTI